jgi:hypothetical protein
MIARNCTVKNLQATLKEINKKYKGNITFKKLEPFGKSFRVTLRTKDSHKFGSTIGNHGRHIPTACWHVHGNFFAALFKINPEATVITCQSKITKDAGNWGDYNVGSMMNLRYASEACECMKNGLLK